MQGVTPALASWMRADWRLRRRTLVALTILIGIAAGGVMAAAAGARRTATSLDRLAAASRTSDVLVDIGDAGLSTARRIDALPSVDESGVVTIVFAVVDGAEFDIGLFLPRGDGVGEGIERDLLLRGRRADPRRPEEVTINEPMAQLAGLDVGDEVEIRTLTPAQVDAESYDPPLGPTLDMTVVGVARGPGDLNARPEGNITATAALYSEVAGAVDEFAMYVAVQLAPGSSLDDFERELAGLAPPNAPRDVLSFAERTRAAERTISTLAAGLAVVAAMAAVAALVTIGQAIARHVGGAVRDDATMRALGMTRRQRRWALAGTVLPAATIGPALGVALAIIASPLTPIGLGRRAEPAPGLRLDAPVLVVGALATAVVVVLAGIAAATGAMRPSRQGTFRRPSRTATAVAHLGAPPSFVNGVALALGRGPRGRQVGSTFAALAVAVIVAVASVTFSASLDRLADGPGRWGAPWDLALNFTSRDVDQAAHELTDDDALAAVGRWDSGAALVNGAYVRAFAVETLRGELGFTVVDGRQPQRGEVVVGPETAERSGLAIGDVVTVAPPDSRDPPGRLRLVGLALFPEIDDGDFEDAIGMTGQDFAAHGAVTDLFEASQLIVRLQAGTSPSATEDRLRDRFGAAVDDARPVRPGAVSNVVGILSMLRLLPLLAAVLALAVFAHAVRSTAEDHAADFTTLRAVGMTRWQRWECSLVQSVTLAAAALLAGVPLGMAIGRRSWSSVAGSIEVARDPFVPAAALAAIVAGTFIVSVAAATVAPRSPRVRHASARPE